MAPVLGSLVSSTFDKKRMTYQPLGGVPKNRCSYFPGYIQIDMSTLILLEQVNFPGGKCYLEKL